MSASRLQSLLRSAYGRGGYPNEQENARLKLKSFFVTADPSDFEITERKPVNGGDVPRTKPSKDVAEATGELANHIRAMADRMTEQKAEIATLRAEVARLQEENDRLTQERDQTPEPVVADTGDEYVAWVDFEAAAITAFGREGAWKSVFAFEADIDIKTLNAWQTVGVIPAKLFDIVKTLTAGQKAPSSRKKWTDAEYRRLEALVAEGKRDREIAKLLTGEFGRKLVESSTTGARRRLFRGR